MKIWLRAQNMQDQYYMKHNITDISHSTNCYKYKLKKNNLVQLNENKYEWKC